MVMALQWFTDCHSCLEKRRCLSWASYYGHSVCPLSSNSWRHTVVTWLHQQGKGRIWKTEVQSETCHRSQAEGVLASVSFCPVWLKTFLPSQRPFRKCLPMLVVFRSVQLKNDVKIYGKVEIYSMPQGWRLGRSAEKTGVGVTLVSSPTGPPSQRPSFFLLQHISVPYIRSRNMAAKQTCSLPNYSLALANWSLHQKTPLLPLLMKLLGLCKATLVFKGQKQEGQEFRPILGYLLRLKPTLYYIKTLFKKAKKTAQIFLLAFLLTPLRPLWCFWLGTTESPSFTP